MTKVTKITNQGFTLIEVMMAMVIFSVGILGLIGMQISAIQGNDDASEISQALAVAQDQLDTLLTLPYSATDLDDDGDGTGQDVDDDGDDDDCDCDDFGLNDNTPTTADGNRIVNGKYNLFWNVAVNEPVANAKRIRMIVRWQNNSRTRQIILEAVKLQ